MSRNSRRKERVEVKLLETVYNSLADTLADPFLYPYTDLYDPQTGERWLPVGGEGGKDFYERVALPRTEPELSRVRIECRLLSDTNEFAICGHENRINYLVGSGHTYQVELIDPQLGQNDPQIVADTQAVLDEFYRLNKWQSRQVEIVRRKDRDGECFLRFFPSGDGALKVRFIEPTQVFCPASEAGKADSTWGIRTEQDDVETVLGYWVDGQLVPADEIQHRKANVDANVKRGLPLFYPVRKNLRRAEKLLRSMNTVAAIQASVAIIRKHAVAVKDTAQAFVNAKANVTTTSAVTGETRNYQRFGPGTILDATKNIDYEFPANAIDATKFVTCLQAELRAIASRLVMPEFMLSSDASNANYSSTMVAEGPAVKMFQRQQFEMIQDDLEIMRKVIATAIAAGRLPANTLELVTVTVTPPNVQTRDRLKESQADSILVRAGAMSRQTMAERNDLDWETEEQRLAQEREKGATITSNGSPPTDAPAGAQLSPDGAV